MTNICIHCSHPFDDRNEPGPCPACGTWNQSERFKAELRAAHEQAAGARERAARRRGDWVADREV